MTVSLGVLVEGPAPQPPLYRLTDAATLIQMGEDEHYLLGLAVRSYPCDHPHAWDWINHLNDDGTSTKVTIQATPSPVFRGFTVYIREQCNTRGLGAQAFAERVDAIFPAIEAYAVEREFWTGTTIPEEPHLAGAIPLPGGADTTIFPTANVAQTAIEGLARLEAEIAKTGRRGFIHAAPSLVTYWASRQLVHKENGTPPTLQTMLGTTIVPGYGYETAAGPTAGGGVIPEGRVAATGTQEWAFATGPIEIRRTADIEITPDATEAALAQAIDRANNLIAYEASRNYIFDWDACFKAAVLIDRAT